MFVLRLFPFTPLFILLHVSVTSHSPKSTTLLVYNLPVNHFSVTVSATAPTMLSWQPEPLLDHNQLPSQDLASDLGLLTTSSVWFLPDRVTAVTGQSLVLNLTY